MRSALLVIVVIAATCGSFLTIGVQRSYADATTPPPWDTFNPTDGATYGSNTDPAGYGAVGSLTFYNSLGQQITGGSTASPFAAYAEGSFATGGIKAQLYFAIPEASDPSAWVQLGLGNPGSIFPNANAPSNLASAGTLPLFTGTSGPSGEESLNDFVAANPDASNPDPGYYQVREITSGNGANGTEENAADILIDTTNNTWTLAYPVASPVGTSTTLTASPSSPQVSGTSVTLTATVTDADTSSPAGGTVQFEENGTAVGSPATVGSNGQATLVTTALPVGSDPLTAVSTPPTGTNYSGSTSNSVPYTVTAATPTLTSASPSQLAVGASGSVTFQGSNLESGATLKITGPSKDVTAPTADIVASGSTLTATVKVSAAAATGEYTVKVTDPNKLTATCTGCLTVIAAPTLTTLSPSSAAQGTSTKVTLTGTGFATGAKVTGPKGVSFSKLTVTSTTITATMKVSATAATGTDLAVTVTNDASAGYGKATADLLTIT